MQLASVSDLLCVSYQTRNVHAFRITLFSDTQYLFVAATDQGEERV